ncbi:hypothetical protein KY290_010880 [Solanum tuberosum]|uniref:Uncharacterized protein n=1 Tax=Solanum tuberosum TaxID=4113 RepID=A0ABQ7W105_SOLTU|nr:hypothetical protein KY290_010880 [Solanum tuberosum]
MEWHRLEVVPVEQYQLEVELERLLLSHMLRFLRTRCAGQLLSRWCKRYTITASRYSGSGGSASRGSGTGCGCSNCSYVGMMDARGVLFVALKLCGCVREYWKSFWRSRPVRSSPIKWDAFSSAF